MKLPSILDKFVSPVTGAFKNFKSPLKQWKIYVGNKDNQAEMSAALQDLKIDMRWFTTRARASFSAPVVLKERHASFPNAMSLKEIANAAINDGPNILRADSEGNLRVSIPDEDHAPAENPKFKGEYIGLPVIKQDDPSYPTLKKGNLRFVESDEGL